MYAIKICNALYMADILSSKVISEDIILEMEGCVHQRYKKALFSYKKL